MQKFGLVVIGAHIGVHIKSEIEEYKNKTIVRPDGTIDYIFKPKGD